MIDIQLRGPPVRIALSRIQQWMMHSLRKTDRCDLTAWRKERGSEGSCPRGDVVLTLITCRHIHISAMSPSNLVVLPHVRRVCSERSFRWWWSLVVSAVTTATVSPRVLLGLRGTQSQLVVVALGRLRLPATTTCFRGRTCTFTCLHLMTESLPVLTNAHQASMPSTSYL